MHVIVKREQSIEENRKRSKSKKQTDFCVNKVFHAFSLAFCISFPSRNNRCKILVNLAKGQVRVIWNSKINIVRESLKSVVMVTSA